MRNPLLPVRLRSSVIETCARSLQILAPALIDLELTLLMYSPNLQLRRAHLALRRRVGLPKTRLCCAANPKLDPGPQVCPRRCLRAGETHSANGFNLPGAAYPYKRAFDTAAEDDLRTPKRTTWALGSTWASSGGLPGARAGFLMLVSRR
jgi:hypothetical protein